MRAALDAIGRTPLLQLPLPDGCRGSLWAKAELLQPGGSVKDRAALGCVEHGLSTGALTPGQPVVEMTSGTMREPKSISPVPVSGMICGAATLPMYLGRVFVPSK